MTRVWPVPYVRVVWTGLNRLATRHVADELAIMWFCIVLHKVSPDIKMSAISQYSKLFILHFNDTHILTIMLKHVA